jgi:hypothetical protein
MANRTVKCICVLHNTVIDREGLDEASLLELQNQEDSFSTNLDEPERQVTRSSNRSNLRARWVRDVFTLYFNSDVDHCLKTVIDYNSADECVTDSDEIMCDGHVLCLINDYESYITFVLFPQNMTLLNCNQ